MDGFDWDDANRGHIALHHLLPNEVELAFSGVTADLDSYDVDGEKRYEDLGMTPNGRV